MQRILVVSSRNQEAVDAVAEKITDAGFEAIDVTYNTGNMENIGYMVLAK